MNKTHTIGDLVAVFHEELKNLYPQGEIESITSLTMDNLLGIKKSDLSLHKEQKIKPGIADKLLSVVTELKTHKPIQYVLGKSDFYRMKLRVNEDVLIPRPETEELVDFILGDIEHKTSLSGPQQGKETKPINILDIGTGSGCIAIALKKNIPDANVFAIDISEEALLIAKVNAILNHAKITFLQADITSPPAPPPKERGVKTTFDIIVSNPPYVRTAEKEKMSKNVLDYEPHLALFVNDNDPLIFYSAIADFASQNLALAGKMYFEINEAMGDSVKKLLEGKGFKRTTVKKDMSGKDRFIISGRK